MKNGQAPHSAGIPKRGGTPYILTPWIHKLNIKTTPILTEVKRYINDDLINSYKTRPGVNDRNSRNKTYDWLEIDTNEGLKCNSLVKQIKCWHDVGERQTISL